MICLNCQRNIEDNVENCPFCNAKYNAEKFRFIKYLGEPDSLVGYQKSYKLVLLMTIFSFAIQEKTLSVDSIMQSVKDYYLSRKESGLLPDYEVDSRIQNISRDTSLYDLWAVFKANPYNAINNQKFLFLEKNIRGELVFAFPSELTCFLSQEEYKHLYNLMVAKLDLYYKKYDEKPHIATNVDVEDDHSITELDSVDIQAPINLEVSILDVGLSARAKNCLMRSGHTTLKSIIDMTDEELLQIRNMGRKSVEEIKEFICALKSGDIIAPLEVIDNKNEIRIISEYDLECNIVNTSLSVRAKNAFGRSGYYKVGEIVDLTMADILDLQNIGAQTAREMLDFIQKVVEENYSNAENSDESRKYPFSHLNEECDLLPVVSLYSFNISQNAIKMLQNCGIYRLGQLRTMDYQQIQDTFTTRSHELLRCNFDVLSCGIINVVEKFLDVMSEEYDLSFIVERSRGVTLAELGDKYSITRERVRQKVEKPLKLIKPMVESLVLTIMAMQHKKCLTLQDIYDLYDNDNYDAIIAYTLKESENIETLAPLGLFVQKTEISCEEILYKCIREFVGEGVFWKANIASLSDILQENGLSFIDVNEVWFYIREMGYKIYKEYVTPQAVPYGNLLATVIESEFPSGISFSDSEQVRTLREAAFERFGDLGLPEGDRPLAARLADQLVLCDRGKWISPNRIVVDLSTIETIKEYIDHSTDNIIYYQSLFNQFQGLLMMTSDIFNYHYLHGVLKYYYSEDYIFARDYLQKDSNNTSGSMSSRIYDYIFSRGEAVTREELKDHLKITSDVMITNVLSNYREVFQWEFNQFNCLGNVSITDVEKSFLDDIILEIMDDNKKYCSAKIVYEYCLQLLPEMLQRNKVKNHTNLFYLVATLLGDKYKCRNPHILPLDSEFTTTDDIARKIIDYPKILRWDDFAAMSDKFGWGRSTAGFVFDGIKNESYCRISQTDYIRREDFIIDTNKIIEITSDMKRVVGERDYVGIWEFNFNKFPELEYPWTPHLFESIIKNYISDYKLITPNVGVGKTERGVCVSSLSCIETFDQLVCSVMKKNGQFELSEGEMHTLLVIAGVIKHSVPNELKESPLFIFDNGKYKLKEESA